MTTVAVTPMAGTPPIRRSQKARNHASPAQLRLTVEGKTCSAVIDTPQASPSRSAGAGPARESNRERRTSLYCQLLHDERGDVRLDGPPC